MTDPIGAASKQLAVYGIKFTPEQLRAAIEAAVYGAITTPAALRAPDIATYVTGQTQA